jgi:hypothetical protein
VVEVTDESHPHAPAPAPAPTVFEHGLPRLLGNFLTGTTGGLSSLVDESELLAATRRLADDLLLAPAPANAAATLTVRVPASALPVVDALYPDAVSECSMNRRAYRAYPSNIAEAGGFGGRVIFVLGAPRSGTTWLAGMLLTHPGTAGLAEAETWIFQATRDLWDLGIAEPEVAAAIRRFCDAVFTAHRDRTRPSATWYVEKTPAHVFRLAEMNRVYPDAVYVHIVRDGRDVARSLAEMDGGADAVADGARHWAAAVRAVRRAAPSLARLREVSYEALVAYPVSGVSDVLAWAGLPVDDDVRRALAERNPIRVSQLGTTGPVGPGKWRSLPRHDLEAIEREAGDVLAELGYSR